MIFQMGDNVKDWAELLLVFFGTLGASSGFWGYIQRKDTTKTATLRLVLALTHDRIVYLGTNYIQRGSITADEYDGINKYLYGPYLEFGGNGLTEKIMAEVARLPLTHQSTTKHST